MWICLVLSPAVFINGLMMVMSSCRHNAAGPQRVVDEVQSGAATDLLRDNGFELPLLLSCVVELWKPREAEECKFRLNGCVTQAGWDRFLLAHAEQLHFSSSQSHLLSVFAFFAENSTAFAKGFRYAKNIDGIAKFVQKNEDIYKMFTRYLQECHRISKFGMNKIKSRAQIFTWFYTHSHTHTHTHTQIMYLFLHLINTFDAKFKLIHKSIKM